MPRLPISTIGPVWFSLLEYHEADDWLQAHNYLFINLKIYHTLASEQIHGISTERAMAEGM